MNVLDILNRLSVGFQRWMQGIPAGSAHVYDWFVTRLLEGSYRYVAGDIGEGGFGRVLDVGCGPGRLLIELARKNTYDLLVGLDVSKAMAYIARRNFIHEGVYGLLDSVVADAQMMPLRGGGFDLVVSIGTLHYMRNLSVFFTECVRVLGNGGFAWIYEPSYDVSDNDLLESSRILKKPKFLLKIIVTLHGIPRREYEEGYIRDALIKSSIKYSIIYVGAITKLILFSEN